jgi:hypothetical protein
VVLAGGVIRDSHVGRGEGCTWLTKLKATVSPGCAAMLLGVNWNLLFAATVTIMVAADAVRLWARAA